MAASMFGLFGYLLCLNVLLLDMSNTAVTSLRPVHTAACVEASALLPIHFEWGDVTIRRTAFWEQSVVFLAVLATKVEQCSTFEAEAEASANQTACMLGEPDRSSFPHMPKNGGENNRSGRESPGAFLFGEVISSVLCLNGQLAGIDSI